VRSDETTGGESPTLQSRLEVAEDGDPDEPGSARGVVDLPIADPAALLQHLDDSGHFHRDGRVGRIYHRGTVSLREDVTADSLHVVVDDNRVAAHIDGLSPLAAQTAGSSGYSFGRAVAHNLSGMTEDLVRLLRGRLGDHGCELNCEWVSGEAPSTPEQGRPRDARVPPLGVQLEARVAGTLDEARLRNALVTALGQRSVTRDALEVVDCASDDLTTARGQLQNRPIAIDEGPPLQVCLARSPAGDTLMLNLNHAVADGAGALQVLRAIARAYRGDADAPVDLLAIRDLPVRPAAAPMSASVRSAKRAVQWLRDALARPAHLAAHEPEDRPGFGFHLLALSPDETRHATDTGHAGTNVLTTALHLAIGDWNRGHGAGRGRIAVLLSVDLRSPDWRQDRIGNFSVTSRVMTSDRDRAGAQSALAAITAQTERNESSRTGIALIAGLQRAGLLALWAKQSVVVLDPLTTNRQIDTAVLSDLGRLDDVPSFGPDAGDTLELWFSTPSRSAMSLCLGAVSVSDRLHLTFRYPHRLFGAGAAQRFAECYLDHLRRVTAGTSGVSPGRVSPAARRSPPAGGPWRPRRSHGQPRR
jgi:NRPS condensation-like uncharacterized protein